MTEFVILNLIFRHTARNCFSFPCSRAPSSGMSRKVPLQGVAEGSPDARAELYQVRFLWVGDLEKTFQRRIRARFSLGTSHTAMSRMSIVACGKNFEVAHDKRFHMVGGLTKPLKQL